MARPKIEELQKHTLNLRKGDMEALEALFPNRQPSVMARHIISKFVDQARQVHEEPVKVPEIRL